MLGSEIASLFKVYESLFGPVPWGRTVHIDCPKCTDTRQRLYLTKKLDAGEGGRILAYCHNCGDNGWWIETPHFAPIVRPMPTTSPSLLVPSDTNYLWDEFPTHARAWLLDSHFRPEQARWWQVGWSDHYQRIVLPVWRATTFVTPVDLLGCQLRTLDPHDPCKYLTMRGSEPFHCLYGLPPYRENDLVVVLVEDLLSAWRVTQAAPYVVPMLGSAIAAERLAGLIKTYRGAKFIVWMDNDGPQIIEARNRIMELGLALGGRFFMCNADKEPKHHDREAVQRIINAV